MFSPEYSTATSFRDDKVAPGIQTVRVMPWKGVGPDSVWSDPAFAWYRLAIPARPGFVCPEDSRRKAVASATVHRPGTVPQKDDVRCFQAPAIHPVIRPPRPPEVAFTAFSLDTGGWRQPAVETAGDRLSLAADAKERWLKPPPSVFSRGGLGFGSERPSVPWLGVLADEHSEFEG